MINPSIDNAIGALAIAFSATTPILIALNISKIIIPCCHIKDRHIATRNFLPVVQWLVVNNLYKINRLAIKNKILIIGIDLLLACWIQYNTQQLEEQISLVHRELHRHILFWNLTN